MLSHLQQEAKKLLNNRLPTYNILSDNDILVSAINFFRKPNSLPKATMYVQARYSEPSLQHIVQVHQAHYKNGCEVLDTKMTVEGKLVTYSHDKQNNIYYKFLHSVEISFMSKDDIKILVKDVEEHKTKCAASDYKSGNELSLKYKL